MQVFSDCLRAAARKMPTFKTKIYAMEDLNLRKLRLIEFILQEHDPEGVRQIEELIVRIAYDEDSRTKIIGFNINSAPVLKSDFLSSIVRSLREVDSGDFQSFEQVEKESESW